MSVYPAALPTVRPAVRSAFEQGSGGGAASIIAGLFSAGQQGFWLPFTDFASLSQDSAGTLPYTALEQPVGRVLDRSGRGNHASQVTSTARGVVSARVNMLEATNDLTNAYWIKGGTTVTAGASAPDGSATAFSVQITTTGNFRYIRPTNLGAIAPATATILAKYDGQRFISILGGGGSSVAAAFDLLNGVVDYVKAGSSASITAVGAGFYKLSYTNDAGDFNRGWWMLTDGGTSPLGTASAGKAILCSPSLVLATQVTLPYQRVTTPTDYDAVGFPKYLRLDGTDDFYTCGGGGSTTGFYYSDVIRPMGGAGTRRVIWSDRSGNSGYELAINASDKLEFGAGNGTTITTVETTQLAALAEGKRYEVMDDGAVLSVQIDGSAPVTVARPVVTAGSYTITLYRGASTGYFNGQITEPIYRAGPPPNAYEREVIRNYQMQKAGL